jgi:hypothetical protein
MMPLAQRLPVFGIPKHLVITEMSFDVVDHRGGRHLAFALAEHAQGVVREVSRSSLLPCPGVATLTSGAAPAIAFMSPVNSVSKANTMMKRRSKRHAFRPIGRPSST